MATFRETREALLLAHDLRAINDAEFVLLYDLNTSKNLDYPYWKYPAFDLDTVADAERKTELRFYRSDVYRMADVLGILDEITCYNRSVFDGIEAFCVFLKRFAYPCRYADMVPRFARPVPELCLMSNEIMNVIFNLHRNRLTSFNQAWLSRAKLEEYANVIHTKGAALQNCWGFIDGTVRPVCCPGENQQLLFNGHKRIHAIKFQSVAAPNGLIANLHGPFEGRKHDSGMLADSKLLNLLQRNSFSSTGQPLCVYGDPAYPLRVHLQGPFKGAHLTPIQREFNTSMSEVRTSVEWVFGEIVDYFSFLDFKKDLKIGLSAVGKMYTVCALMANAHTCLYKSMTSYFFDLEPPQLEEYFA